LALVQGLTQGMTTGLSALKAVAVGLAPACVFTTGIVWYNENRWERIITVTILFWLSSIVPIYQLLAIINRGPGLPVWVVIAYSLVFIVSCLFIISHLLEANALTYRLRTQELSESWNIR